MKFGKITKFAVGAIAAITAWNSFFILDQTEQAVVTRFGNPKRVIVNPISNDERTINQTEDLKTKCRDEGIKVSEGPGVYLKAPFIDNVKRTDRRIMRWDGYPEQINTKDKKYLFIDTTLRWRVYDPLKFLRTVGTKEQAYARFDEVVDSITRNNITKRDLIEIVRSTNRPMQVTEKELEETVQVGNITEGREKIILAAGEEARKICDQYGVEIVEFGYLIKGLHYVEDVKTKVEDRMISERQRIAEKYRSEGRGEAQKIMGEKELAEKTIISEAYKTAQIIRGTGEAKSIEIYGETYSQDPTLYQFLGSLELYKKFDSKTSLLLGTDSEFLKYIKGPVIQTIKPAK